MPDLIYDSPSDRVKHSNFMERPCSNNPSNGATYKYHLIPFRKPLKAFIIDDPLLKNVILFKKC